MEDAQVLAIVKTIKGEQGCTQSILCFMLGVLILATIGLGWINQNLDVQTQLMQTQTTIQMERTK